MNNKIVNACVCGYPIDHSLSPLIHNYWLDLHQIQGSYQKISIPAQDFPHFLQTMQEKNLIGCNVTIPHKETAYHLSEIKDDISHIIGAANTLWFEEGKLHATNTDAYGFLANLDHYAQGWDGKKTVLVLGAGGASRAVLYGLIERGFTTIMLINRTFEKALELEHRFRSSVKAYHFEQMQDCAQSADLIVNTTSVGMKGVGSFNIDMERLNAHTLVTDLVYTPLITPLLRDAKAAGLKTVDGLGMLLHQAAPAFEKFFGLLPSVTPELRQLVSS
jgi:shikimate dehydrogenase